MTCLAHPPFPLPCPMLYHNTRINSHISIPSAHLHTPPYTSNLRAYIYTVTIWKSPFYTVHLGADPHKGNTCVLKSALQVVGAGSLPIEAEADLKFRLALTLLPWLTLQSQHRLIPAGEDLLPAWPCPQSIDCIAEDPAVPRPCSLKLQPFDETSRHTLSMPAPHCDRRICSM